jgi:aminoglycoside phosphotransferase (APT) family kinase protein
VLASLGGAGVKGGVLVQESAGSRHGPDDAVSAANALVARLLRTIRHELANRISPELKSADAIERANFVLSVLQILADDVEVLPRAAASVVPGLRQTLADCLAKAGGIDNACAQYAAELEAIRTESGAAVAAELAALRDLASRVLRHLADAADAASSAEQRDVLRASTQVLGRGDADWLAAYESACATSAGPSSPASIPAGDATAIDLVTTAGITAYLQRRFPAQPSAIATEVVLVPGGRSKKTYFVRIANAGDLPGELVMRQDYALKYVGTKVVEEYRPLLKLSALGLPVPRPIHLEPESSELGPPFMWVSRLAGKPPGSYFGIAVACPGAFRDLAAMLAKLHCTEPATLGMGVAGGGDPLQALFGRYQTKWRDNVTCASPVVDFAFAWAMSECRRDPPLTTAVHGDAGPHNLLVEGDRLTAVLDWEFAHIGDPAEDLGIARVYAESFMPWDEFIGVYREAGGPAVPDRRVRLGMLTHYLKGATLVATSGRNFREGGTSDFIKGASSFTGLRLIERRITELLKRFGAF